jgi:hypothetical protein
MFKRVRWVSVGFVAGAASSYAVVRRAKRVARRYRPPELVDRLQQNATGVRRNVSAAVFEGRTAMRERQADLQAEVARRSQ